MKHPQTMGQYQILEPLAAGGAGEVYRGLDTKLGREVAIKFLRPELASDASYLDRFLVEAKSLARLNHPNIATLYALPYHDDQVCMIMEFVRGHTVEKLIAERGGKIGVQPSLAIMAQVADGLSYAHEEGVVHRDIKPSNLIISESGRVKIMDFGIARVRGSARLTRVGSAIGTPLYMSPEQHRGLEGDERSDIYSLAIVLYELLAGAPPFKGATDFDLAKAHNELPPPPLIPRITGVEPGLESAIMTALAKRPEQRFSTMRAFSEALGASALRGDASAIINRYMRSAQGAAVDQPRPARMPIHTLALSLVRSRMAAAARRFRGLHPAVQGVVVGAVIALGALGFLFYPETAGPTNHSPTPPRETRSERQEIGFKVPPQVETDRASGHTQPNFNTSTRARDETSCDSTLFDPNEPGGCVTHDKSDPAKGVLQRSYEAKPTPPPVKAAPLAETKLAMADFEAAEQMGNYGVAFDIAKKLDAAGDPAGAYGLGDFYVHGYGRTPKDPTVARGHFERAAEKGFPQAMVKLGLMYYEGVGGEKDKRAARDWFEKAAASGDEKAAGAALWALGTMCKRGALGRCNPEEFYAKAREAGYTPEK